jgi:hypothetical protein
MYRAYSRKNDMDEPPMLSDDESDSLEDGEQPSPTKKSKAKEEDKLNLEARYYRFGVNPDWMQIFRILNHRYDSYYHKIYSLAVKGLGLISLERQGEKDFISHLYILFAALLFIQTP